MNRETGWAEAQNGTGVRVGSGGALQIQVSPSHTRSTTQTPTSSHSLAGDTERHRIHCRPRRHHLLFLFSVRKRQPKEGFVSSTRAPSPPPRPAAASAPMAALDPASCRAKLSLLYLPPSNGVHTFSGSPPRIVTPRRCCRSPPRHRHTTTP
ncbi:hypothetical protein LR48_Vigan11g149800 [Vigna angularis]|uniref:Uncharacterized protein n=1 Tax=Phaseolus angularis TaxID=3914 RepID=A0A0L9VUN1_PHAAN|nr:hypothetical protein LR48_Vigan11g149800 [Vigna angularis]